MLCVSPNLLVFPEALLIFEALVAVARLALIDHISILCSLEWTYPQLDYCNYYFKMYRLFRFSNNFLKDLIVLSSLASNQLLKN